MGKVSREVAVSEVNRWLDAKKLSDKKRESKAANIEMLVDSIEEGVLYLNEDNVFVHVLKFPIESTDGKVAFDKFEYKLRINMALLNMHLAGVKSDDADGRMVAFISALTAKPKDIVKKLDTEDNSVAQAIAVFFA